MSNSGDRTPRWKQFISNNKYSILFILIVVLALGYVGFQNGEQQEVAYMMYNDAIVIGADSNQLDVVCQEQFGNSWESKFWLPNNPPTVVCQNGQGTTAYMDMPVEVQRDLDIVSTANNGTQP